MPTRLICLLALLPTLSLMAQPSYRIFFTGDTTDVVSLPAGGIVLAGGGGDHDGAMRWFLQHGGGGDVVVLRASGADGYNDYLFRDLGVTVNSVETILTTDRTAAYDPYVIRRIREAEALWIAGGDQANYVNFWKDSPVEDALRYLIHVKKVPVGGTSAGMAIQGGGYFAALNGTVYSPDALRDPYVPEVSVGYGDFLDHPFLGAVVTDTHYDARERQGRHLVFLARLAHDHGVRPKGIACEEKVAVCIDTQGIARVFGNYPGEEDFAVFLQASCENGSFGPEICTPGQPLHWVRNHSAVWACRVAGTPDGAGTFDLRDWKTAGGAINGWQHWWVDEGTLHRRDTPLLPDCTGRE